MWSCNVKEYQDLMLFSWYFMTKIFSFCSLHLKIINYTWTDECFTKDDYYYFLLCAKRMWFARVLSTNWSSSTLTSFSCSSSPQSMKKRVRSALQHCIAKLYPSTSLLFTTLKYSPCMTDISNRQVWPKIFLSLKNHLE